MRILYPAGVRREWFDRNPVVANYAYGATVAPHVSTTRITVSGAAGKRNFLQSIYLFIQRNTVATAVGEASINVTLNDGATYAVLLNNVFNNNTAGAFSIAQLSFDWYFYAGQTVYVTSYDNSTGGSLNLTANLSVVTFDG